MSGCRANQVISSVGFTGYYWSSTVSDTLSKYFSISNSGSSFGNFNRARGASVRCIRDSMGFSVSLPIISTDSVSGITSASAISGGTLISDGGSMITERGVCWRTTPNPTIANSTTNDGVSIGSFTSNLTGLDLLTTYYVRAYATNIAGTAYGNEMVFSTTHFVDPCAGVPIPPGFGIVSSSGKCWLDRNLGAIQVATSSTDESSYGTLYQWGRGTDGHQIRTSSTTPILSSGDTPGHGSFITIMDIPYDWRSPQNVNLWQGVNGVNNPCPVGWRVPTDAEWTAERLNWVSSNAAGAFASPLKLTMGGLRNNHGGLNYVDTRGVYWSSTIFGVYSRILEIQNNNSRSWYKDRAVGGSVRCIKD